MAEDPRLLIDILKAIWPAPGSGKMITGTRDGSTIRGLIVRSSFDHVGFYASCYLTKWATICTAHRSPVAALDTARAHVRAAHGIEIDDTRDIPLDAAMDWLGQPREAAEYQRDPEAVH